MAAQHRRLLGQPKDEVLADLRARHPLRSPEMLELLAGARLRTRMEAFELLRPPNPDYRLVVGAIRVPVLLVTGDAPVVSAEAARQLQALNPRLRVAEIAGAGHGLPYDQPQRLAAAVRAFLRGGK